MSIRRQLPRFLVAGSVGFLVDAGVLYAALAVGLDYYSGRVASFLAAVVTTWLINRNWTFEAGGRQSKAAEFARYFSAMALGGAVNYAVYALIVAVAPRTAWLPLAAVAAGSIAGLGVNFATARQWVFGVAAAGARADATGAQEPASALLMESSQPQAWTAATFWTLLAAGLLGLKFLGLVLDPQPQFFMGDSASYLHTALTNWVPPDRSYLYGVIVRTIVGDTQSLAPLLLVQATASAATAVLAASWSQLVFRPGRTVLCVVALLCALDPSQLLYERYVMTETFALLSLALMIVSLTCVIVRGQWLWMLPAAAAAATVVALRMSLLPVVLASLGVAPLLALAARTLSLRQAMLGVGVAVLFVPLVAPLVTRIQSGPFLLAAWSPLLTPRDFADPAQGERVLEGIDVANPELFAREVNLWHPSGFMYRLTAAVADPRARSRLARETALAGARMRGCGTRQSACSSCIGMSARIHWAEAFAKPWPRPFDSSPTIFPGRR
jgi:putative flippase GtrA